MTIAVYSCESASYSAKMHDAPNRQVFILTDNMGVVVIRARAVNVNTTSRPLNPTNLNTLSLT